MIVTKFSVLSLIGNYLTASPSLSSLGIAVDTTVLLAMRVIESFCTHLTYGGVNTKLGLHAVCICIAGGSVHFYVR